MSNSNFAPKRTNYDTGDSRWLRKALGALTDDVTLDGDLFTNSPAGVLVKSGTDIGVTAASPHVGGPYNGTTEEVQTVTLGGAGLTSYTLTFGGQTTAAIAPNATAGQLADALEALSSVGEGNVAVTGNAGGPYTVTFIGDLANTNVAQMTSTPTGGSGTVTVATATAGGAPIDTPAGLGKSKGLLRNDLLIKPGERHLVALVVGGTTIDRRFLPDFNHDESAEADLTALVFIN